MARLNLKGLLPPQGSMILCSQYLWESSRLTLKLWGKLREYPRQLQKGNDFHSQYPSTAISGISNSSVIPGKQYDRSKYVSFLPNYWLSRAHTWSCSGLLFSALQAGAGMGFVPAAAPGEASPSWWSRTRKQNVRHFIHSLSFNGLRHFPTCQTHCWAQGTCQE